MYLHEGWWYSCITSYWCQPIIYRTKDGSLFVFVGLVDQVAQYEAQTAILHGRMYALLRGAEGDNFFISDDLGKSFKPCGRIEFNTTQGHTIEEWTDVLKIYRDCGGEIITIGSDAHATNRVGQYACEVCDMFKDIFGYVCTFENRQPIFHKL
mgnify:CR=1 FL=1